MTTVRPFDITAFVQDIGKLPSEQIRTRTLDEMAQISSVNSREAHIEFERALYMRKLSRLLYFLDQRQMPPDVTPKERAAYDKLREWLEHRDTAGRAMPAALSN